MGFLTSLLAATLYVQIAPDRLSVRDPKSGKAYSEPPDIAVARGPKPRIVAIGLEARLRAAEPGVELVNPFAHARSLVSDFTLGEQLLKAAIGRVKGAGIGLAPRIVMHPLGDPAGGYTQVEIRVLHEMALGAGASEVRLWQGRPLTDAELIAGSFPPDGRLLA